MNLSNNPHYRYSKLFWGIFAWCFSIVGIVNSLSLFEKGSLDYWLLTALCYFIFLFGIIIFFFEIEYYSEKIKGIKKVLFYEH